MNVALSERVKQAGSIAFRAGMYERAIALYTEALPPTDAKPDLKVNLLPTAPCATSSSASRRGARRRARGDRASMPTLARATTGWRRRSRDLGRLGEARRQLAEVLPLASGGKNADATKMLEELDGKPTSSRPAAATPRAAAAAARRRRAARRRGSSARTARSG